MSSPAPIIRKITEHEKVDLFRGREYAYAEWSQREIDKTWLQTIEINDIWGVWVNDQLVASLANYDFQQSVRGILKSMGGIGAVWTYPEYRNCGYVRALMATAFKEMRQRQTAVSMLSPFKETFYSQFGYVTANANMDVKVPLQALSHLLKVKNDAAWQIDRRPAQEVKPDFLSFLLTVAPQHHGLTLPVDITDQQWQSRMQKSLCVSVKHHQQVMALAIYAIDATASQSKRDAVLQVSQLFWTTLAARDRLLRFFASHRDQIGYLLLDLPFGTNFFQWFENINEPYELGMMTHSRARCSPYMVRVVDVASAITGLSASIPGRITIEVTDPDCDWNNQIFTVQSTDSALVVTGDRHSVDIRTTIQGISALVYGVASLPELEHRQWLTILNPDVRYPLSHWFKVLPLYSTFRF